MRKPSSDQNEPAAEVKKRRSRRKSGSSGTADTEIGASDEVKMLQEQLEQLQMKVAVREQETRKREEAAQSEAARKQVEAQRLRLEEALLLAKESKRVEELTGPSLGLSQEEVVYSKGSDLSASEEGWMPAVCGSEETVKAIEVASTEKSIMPVSEKADLTVLLLERLNSANSEERANALSDLSRITCNEAFPLITKSFDDSAPEVRAAAARALHNLQSDSVSAFARALRESTPQRKRNIAASLSASGLAENAISSLAGTSREETHKALGLLFLMAKAGEIRPLMTAIEDEQSLELRLAVVNLLSLSGRSEIIPPFRRLAVRGSLPSELKSAVMEAIYKISSLRREAR